MKYIKKIIITFECLLIAINCAMADGLTKVILDELILDENSYWNGSDMSGGFISQGVVFFNSYTDWGVVSTVGLDSLILMSKTPKHQDMGINLL